MSRAYKVVDAFSAAPFLGNPVAVILDGRGLDSGAMQAIASWTNLSETTFVLPPTSREADYLLRIFNPVEELPFAGHPTLGSAHAIIEAGIAQPRDGKLIQQCGAGLVNVKVVEGNTADRLLTLSLPKASVSTLTRESSRELEAIIGHDIVWEAEPAVIDVGPRWLVAQVNSVEALLGLKPDMGRVAECSRRVGVTGFTLFAQQGAANQDIEVRTFAPVVGVPEDPVCGSGNGSVGVFRSIRGQLAAEGSRYCASQGRCVGRDGKIAMSVDSTGQVYVGGPCVTTVDGSIHL